MSNRHKWIFAVVLLGAFWALPVSAQFSPGELAQAHQHLDGLKNCTQCHELGKAQSNQPCLNCHTAIAELQHKDKSIHSLKSMGATNCARCHADHKGQDFAMIHWPQGRDSFAHSITEFALQEAHAGLSCRECHRESLIAADFLGAHSEVNPDSSFLGLGMACTQCHQDPHENGLGSTCVECHSARRWENLPGFRHTKIWPLRGAHRDLACEKCHLFPQSRDPLNSTAGQRLWRGLEGQHCTDCHRDPHDAQLGSRCLDCHTENSFRNRSSEFDHELTAWPLKSAHRRVNCEACHQAQMKQLKPDYQFCTDCHTDVHKGQFSESDSGVAECTTCHTQEFWRPAEFGLVEHRESGWPLLGMHQAIPCQECHRSPGPASTVVVWRQLPNECGQCHKSPHEARADLLDCSTCHDSEQWQIASFDHGTTEFPLLGAHTKTSCASCHKSDTEVECPLGTLEHSCTACHGDPHVGQFQTNPQISCLKCHTQSQFRPATESHQRPDSFPLEGAHAGLECRACHRFDASLGEQGAVRYRGLGQLCTDCHGTKEHNKVSEDKP